MKDIYTKQWIIYNSIEIVSQYRKGVLTLRALHYQLVGIGMTNDLKHYKKVVNAMISARWEGLISFDTFSDLDREMVGSTSYEETTLENEVDKAKGAIEDWMQYYSKNKWENQPYYPEVFIEKKALQGVFQRSCLRWRIALGACKGYPSLTFLYEAKQRFETAIEQGKKPVILYFGDYDPSGEDIPRSIEENLLKFGIEVEIRRIALMQHQVIEWNLPPAPAKETDTRTAQWTGLGQIELDAVKPDKLMALLEDAINSVFSHDLFSELTDIEAEEQKSYRYQIRQFVNSFGQEE